MGDDDMKPKLNLVTPPMPIEPADEELLSLALLTNRLNLQKKFRPAKRHIDVTKRGLKEQKVKDEDGEDLGLWEPTIKDRLLVKAMIATGLASKKAKKSIIEELAKIICPFGPISITTFRRRFKEEIKYGEIEIQANLITRGLEMALSNRFPHLTLHFLKTVCGLRELSTRDEKEQLDSQKIAENMKKAAETMINLTMAPPPTGE